jgi:6-phosphogluconate dehydrogenase
MRLVLYSKPGCHLCEGLEEKLAALAHLDFDLRDSRYHDSRRLVSALSVRNSRFVSSGGNAGGTNGKHAAPAIAPRPNRRVEQMLQTYLEPNKAK